jgi:Sulfatase
VAAVREVVRLHHGGSFLRSVGRLSIRRTVVFWWGLFLIIQQAERLFLLAETVSFEPPTWGLVVSTLVVGLRADLIVATIGVLLAYLLAGVLWALYASRRRLLGLTHARDAFRSRTIGGFLIAGLLLMAGLTIDMGYYGYSHQRIDLTFFEYVDDLFAPSGAHTNQAAAETAAQLTEVPRWAARLALFIGAEFLAVLLWWHAFTRIIEPALARWSFRIPQFATALLVLGLVVGATGFHPESMWAVRKAPIINSVYYLLSQNPLWYAAEIGVGLVAFRMSGRVNDLLARMPLDEAIQQVRMDLSSRGSFPSARYPLVRETSDAIGGPRPRPANIVLIFVEGLDRRYLGLRVTPGSGAVPSASTDDQAAIRVTPFLDHLKDDSVYFENFFSNATTTTRGLFATLCSSYPRVEWDVMRVRYLHDFLCLPSVLGKAGYRTEMVIAQSKGSNRADLGLFLARNGIQQLFDVSDFPSQAEKLGLGATDGALFDFLADRVETLQASGQPFFVTTLTVGTHSPFKVPTVHPDVRALQKHGRNYVAALRALDLAAENFFRVLRRKKLLKDTMLLILGDHGSHAPLGSSDVQRWAGHFTTPLFIWLDESLRSAMNYRPHSTQMVASQVDVTPTVLGLNGLTPRVSPHMGQDLSCVLATECLDDNWAYLRGWGRIGLAVRTGLTVFTVEGQSCQQTDLQVKNERPCADDEDVAARYRRVLALLVSSGVLLEQNRLWSVKEFGAGP